MTSAWILAAVLGVAADPVGGASAALELLETQPAHLETPATFIQDGEEVRRSEGILVRVRVPDPDAFVPRATTDPLFVYGLSVCRRVKSPMESGEAIVLCPLPARGEREVLWLTDRGAIPKMLRGARAESEYQKANARGSSRVLALKRPPAGVAQATFRDLETLRDDVLQRSRKKQPLKR